MLLIEEFSSQHGRITRKWNFDWVASHTLINSEKDNMSNNILVEVSNLDPNIMGSFSDGTNTARSRKLQKLACTCRCTSRYKIVQAHMHKINASAQIELENWGRDRKRKLTC